MGAEVYTIEIKAWEIGKNDDLTDDEIDDIVSDIKSEMKEKLREKGHFPEVEVTNRESTYKTARV
jgi:hypothetical protein